MIRLEYPYSFPSNHRDESELRARSEPSRKRWFYVVCLVGWHVAGNGCFLLHVWTLARRSSDPQCRRGNPCLGGIFASPICIARHPDGGVPDRRDSVVHLPQESR